jgi:HSP20 family protein
MLKLFKDFGLAPYNDSWFNREVDRFFSPLQLDSRSVDCRALVNVYANNDKARVIVSLPGWKAEWFDLSVEGDHLEVSGKSKYENEQKSELNFKRKINLPFRVEDGKVEANYKNGLLTIDLERSEQDKPRKIVVNAA